MRRRVDNERRPVRGKRDRLQEGKREHERGQKYECEVDEEDEVRQKYTLKQDWRLWEYVESGLWIMFDERKQRDGRPLQFLGYYDPKPDDELIRIDIEGIEAWVAKGAQMSDRVKSLVKRARKQAVTAAGAS